MTDTFPYPTGSVVGVLTDETTLADARLRLDAAGLTVEVLHGAPGLVRIDAWGVGHGRSGTIMRKVQAVFSDDADHAHRYAEHLRSGHYVVGVAVGEDEAAKRSATDALDAAEFVNFYADRYVEALRP